jgi:ABC-2 type transport system permease protein
MSVTMERTDGDLSIPPAGAFEAKPRRSENSLRKLIPHTLVQTQRLLRRLARNPLTIVQALVVPILFLLAINLVLGDTIKTITGHSAVYGNVPMSTLSASMAGSAVGAVGLLREHADGLLARLWVVPVHRVSGLLARLLAEAIRVVLTVVVVMSVGMALGLRFHQGIPSAIAWLSIPVIWGVAFASLVITACLYFPKAPVAEAISLVVALGIFLCTGFVPLDQYPEWIQPVVEHQPLTYAVETMRALALGNPVGHSLQNFLLWACGIVAVCAIPMVLGYRRASRRG